MTCDVVRHNVDAPPQVKCPNIDAAETTTINQCCNGIRGKLKISGNDAPTLSRLALQKELQQVGFAKGVATVPTVVNHCLKS